jgi:hypothetical protein
MLTPVVLLQSAEVVIVLLCVLGFCVSRGRLLTDHHNLIVGVSAPDFYSIYFKYVIVDGRNPLGSWDFSSKRGPRGPIHFGCSRGSKIISKLTYTRIRTPIGSFIPYP